MNVSSPQNPSLYETALSFPNAPAPIQVSPTTLHCAIAAFLDWLVGSGGATVLWLKLPRGDIWQAEVERYCQRVREVSTVYLCHRDRGEIEALSDRYARTTLQPLPLATDAHFRGEYFAIGRSSFETHLQQEMSAGILAYRAPVAKGKRDPHLMSLCTADATIIERAIAQIYITTGVEGTTPQPNTPCSTSEVGKNEVGKNAASDWIPLWRYQIQQQEELWRRIGVRESAQERQPPARIQELQRENDRLNESLRLKDEFLSNAAMHLRTPLTNMKTALTLLGSPKLKLSQRQRYMDILLTQCEHQSLLIDGLLELVRLENLVEDAPMEAVSLADIVPGIASTYQPLATEKGVMLAYTIPADLPQVACLSAWLKQIVRSLIDNAMRFTPQGGKVWLQAKPQGTYVRLNCTDTGMGIPETELPKIFDRFYRGRQPSGMESGGAGLGLTIVRQLLQRCGGSISVSSQMGKGSTFKVLLPVYSTVETPVQPQAETLTDLYDEDRDGSPNDFFL